MKFGEKSQKMNPNSRKEIILFGKPKIPRKNRVNLEKSLNSELLTKTDSEFEFSSEFQAEITFNEANYLISELFSENLLPYKLNIKASDLENIRKLKSFLENNRLEFFKSEELIRFSDILEIKNYKVLLSLRKNFKYQNCVLDSKTEPKLREIVIDVFAPNFSPEIAFLHEMGHILSWEFVEKARKMENSFREQDYVFIREIMAWKVAIQLMKLLKLDIPESDLISQMSLALESYVNNGLAKSWKLEIAYFKARRKLEIAYFKARILISYLLDGDFIKLKKDLEAFTIREAKKLGLLKRILGSE